MHFEIYSVLSALPNPLLQTWFHNIVKNSCHLCQHMNKVNVTAFLPHEHTYNTISLSKARMGYRCHNVHNVLPQVPATLLKIGLFFLNWACSCKCSIVHGFLIQHSQNCPTFENNLQRLEMSLMISLKRTQNILTVHIC